MSLEDALKLKYPDLDEVEKLVDHLLEDLRKENTTGVKCEEHWPPEDLLEALFRKYPWLGGYPCDGPMFVEDFK